MKANELMSGNLVMVNKDGVCIPKGTIVRVVEVDSENKFTAKGLVGSARCVDVSDRSVSGGIWCEYLSPIPLSHEILAKICSFEEHILGTSATEEVTYYIFDRLRIKHNTEDWRHEYFCVEGIPYELKWLHQLQQLFTISEVEKEITLDGVCVDIPLEPLP